MRMIDLDHIRRWSAQIAETDDPETEAGYLDTLDGETDALDIADRLIRSVLRDETMSEAASVEAKQLQARAKRYADRAARGRQVIGELLDAMQVRKIERPRATVSRTAGRTHADIVDPDAVPTQLCQIKRQPDATAIRKALEAGEDVPGAVLARGSDSISMRVA
ncbi:hypothetical protein DRW48_10320 [Paracoccus suum]|uniref:Siphovirus Gp157 family protein n=1 Tax=Paracoccus suum TaxID=2259340 RepID=A0A344PKX7_9RHOB|nr:siphovirus Gp157 family protein [Paracoccus suum]AXC50032.1 hypothetical protein DRW48_10320 [Paracoccus suum]